MFDANDSLIPPIHSKTEMSYKNIYKEYFQPNIGRKIRISSLGRKNNILIEKKSVFNFLSLCPLDLVVKLNFNISKGPFSRRGQIFFPLPRALSHFLTRVNTQWEIHAFTLERLSIECRK